MFCWSILPFKIFLYSRVYIIKHDPQEVERKVNGGKKNKTKKDSASCFKENVFVSWTGNKRKRLLLLTNTHTNDVTTCLRCYFFFCLSVVLICMYMLYSFYSLGWSVSGYLFLPPDFHLSSVPPPYSDFFLWWG